MDPHVELLEREGTDWVTPDVPADIIADINTAPSLARYKHELIQGARVQYELAVLRQARIREAEQRIERARMDGIGEKVASIDLELFLRLEQCWGRNWWRDRKVLRQVLKENPFLAVRMAPAKCTIVVDGFRDRVAAGSITETPLQPPSRRLEEAA